MENTGRGRRAMGQTPYAQPRPGTRLPVFNGQRVLDAMEAMDDRRGVVESGPTSVCARGRA
eukprot:4792528-Lingulodinium_polyedra.AAC.1